MRASGPAKGVHRDSVPKAPKLWPPGPLKVMRKRGLPIASALFPRPSPSMETNRSILPFQRVAEESFDSAKVAEALFTHRARRRWSPAWTTAALFNARTTASRISQAPTVVTDARASQHGTLAPYRDGGPPGNTRCRDGRSCTR